MTSNGSFQNQPPAVATSRKRKRGISALLLDVTNLCGETQARTARVKARREIQSHQRCFAPRGKPKQGARAKCLTAAANVGESAPTEPTTLSDVMDDNHIISDTWEHIQQYTKRKASYEAQKAMAIAVMTTAITKWGCNIIIGGC